MQMKPGHNLQTRPATPILAEAAYKLQPGEMSLIASRMPHLIGQDATGIVTFSAKLEEHNTLSLVSSISTVKNNAEGYHVYSFSELPCTITTDTHLANFRVLSPEQLQFIIAVNPSTLTFTMHQHIEKTDVYLNELLEVNNRKDQTEQYWFPTSAQPGEPATNTPIQKRIVQELSELQALEKLNPQDDGKSRKQFLDRFDWSDTTLTPFKRQKVEKFS